MADRNICSVCVREAELGLTVDTAHSRYYWADKLGVGESSVRRHLKHGPGQRLGGNEKKKSENKHSVATGANQYTETWKGDEGTIDVVISGEKIDNEGILKKFGHDPDNVSIVGTLEETHWQNGAGEWQHRYKFKTERNREEDLTIEDLPLLYSQVMDRDVASPRESLPAQPVTNRATVVVWADVQVGKTGSRGGTPELIERIGEKREKLRQYLGDNPADKAYFLSVGDEVESFENTAQQMFTNDLSFPDQLDLELTFELDMITDLSDYADEVIVSGCSSNHCRWRAGKNALGAPKDDYGLYIKRQLEKALRLSERFDGVSFVYPEEWDETVAVDVLGTKIGLAHGHQVSNPNNIEGWWTKQVFGAQATAEADILLTGHFHTFRAQPIGRSLRTGKNRWWLQAPTLDNGSDWFRNLQGSDSDAGLLVFQVDENGLDLSSLTIL